MLEEKEVKKIKELREKGLTVKDISKAVGCSESSVKKYISDEYENNKIDGKTAKTLTDQMIEEEYDFEDEIKPLVYSLKIQASEIDITLYDYLKDISNTMNKFLRITDTPEWFYYVFMEIAKNLSVITNHIEANDLMNAIDLFYNREINMENAETFITDIEAKAEKLVENAKEELSFWEEKIIERKKEHTRLTSLNTVILSKMIEMPNQEKFKLSEERVEILEKEIKKLQMGNQILIEKGKLLEKTDKDNEIVRQNNVMFNMVYERLYKLFPQEIDVIIQEIDNEAQ